VQIGVTLFTTDRTIAIPRLARALEERGYHSLWVPEHTHIPLSRDTQWPMADQDLPEDYRRCYDPFVAMTAAAVVTERLIVATGICLVAQHDPIILAKQVASLDHVSNGRLIFGVGFGWNEDEMRQHGVDPKYRRSIGRDKLGVMRSLWTDEVSEYEGRFASLGPSWQFPKPVQKPYPPLLIGGGKAVLGDVATWADGWMPIEGPMPVLKLLARLREQTTEAGRDPDSLAVHVSYAEPTFENLDRYQEAGVDGVVLQVHPDPEAEVLALLDRHQHLVERYATS
jgi:probable F420-dependent oxidoreductase